MFSTSALNVACPALVLLGIVALAAAAGEELPKLEHPWYSVELDETSIARAKSFVGPIMEMSAKQIRELIPARKPINSWAKFPIPGTVIWWPEKPECITVGGETFVPEQKFPPTDELTITGHDGKKWTYDCLESAIGEPIYPGCVRDFAARNWFVRAASELANLYSTTKDEVYARKAEVIIERFSEIYPSYPIYGRISTRGKYTFHDTEPYPETSAKWGEWYPVDLVQTAQLAQAYELILVSGIIGKLSEELRRDVKEEIETNFFLDHCRLTMKYNSWHAVDLTMRTHNLHPSKCQGMIAIGRTIGHPEIVHYAYSFVKGIDD